MSEGPLDGAPDTPGDEEVLRAGGWSPGGIAAVVVAVLIASGVLVGVLVSHAGHDTATPARTATSPSGTRSSTTPRDGDSLASGSWSQIAVARLANDQRSVIASGGLVNYGRRAVTIDYPIIVTGPGVGTTVEIWAAVVGAGSSSAAGRPPPRITRMARLAHAQLWMGLRVDCRGPHSRKPRLDDLTIKIVLGGGAAPAIFTFGDVFGGEGLAAC
jgi:hypothetical protein